MSNLMHPRQWEVWESSFCADSDGEDQALRALVGSIPGLVLGLITGATLDSLFLPSGIAIAIFIGISVFVTLAFSQLHRVSALRQVPYLYWGVNPRVETRYYLRMTKEERREYPRDILAVMRNPDVTEKQKARLAEQMRELRRQIEEKREVAAKLKARHVNIDSILAVLEDNTQGVASEVETYREGLAKVIELR